MQNKLMSWTSFDPFLDFDHRQYWVAFRSHGCRCSYSNSCTRLLRHQEYVSFPKAEKGTSECLITSALTDMRNELQSKTGSVNRGSPLYSMSAPPVISGQRRTSVNGNSHG
ncbi:hypothetical protein DFH29DRAFT_425888 [Suillus ampliporus]|nr:hypothetical protein DFH29DRAFT_425888 [Suillus ampliporus]